MVLPSSWILCSDYAGLQAQALGLAEAAGLSAEMRVLRPRAPWRWLTATAWPLPLRAVAGQVRPPLPGLVLGCGGTAAPVGAALRRRGPWVVHVQHPRMRPDKFDLVVVNRHDGLTGPNVIVTRTALHRVTDARLQQAAETWRPRFAHLPRPLVAVLVGGANVRFRLDRAIAEALGTQLAEMMRLDRAGIALTPSRRTAPDVISALREAVEPLGGYVWDGQGDNPYFGMLALADLVVVTQDSVSMLSEAVATAAPVMMAALPGGSRRQGIFTDDLLASGRIRRFAGRLEQWPAASINDTLEAGAELRRRLGF